MISANPNMSLCALSETLGVERHIIERVVHEHAGFSFRELKKCVRVKRALFLLSGKRPVSYVKEIAPVVGITPNALSRLIKNMTGCSARELKCHKW